MIRNYLKLNVGVIHLASYNLLILKYTIKYLNKTESI